MVDQIHGIDLVTLQKAADVWLAREETLLALVERCRKELESWENEWRDAAFKAQAFLSMLARFDLPKTDVPHSQATRLQRATVPGY